jgi:hypothetical protein
MLNACLYDKRIMSPGFPGAQSFRVVYNTVDNGVLSDLNRKDSLQLFSSEGDP